MTTTEYTHPGLGISNIWSPDGERTWSWSNRGGAGCGYASFYAAVDAAEEALVADESAADAADWTDDAEIGTSADCANTAAIAAWLAAYISRHPVTDGEWLCDLCEEVAMACATPASRAEYAANLNSMEAR